MKTAIVIPARFASTRLPGKPLLTETGWPLIRHVWEQAQQVHDVARVIVATDDQRIADAVTYFGGEFMMTRNDHATGSDRLAEVALRLNDIDLIVNVQGDEPEIEPEKIKVLIDLYQAADAQMATLVTRFSADKLSGNGSPQDAACVKAVLGAPVQKNGKTLGFEALYFSRSLMPFPRDTDGVLNDASRYFMHLGIYAYSPQFLQKFVAMPQGTLEQIEKLEQLRALENGAKIVAGIVDGATPGIDTPEDYAAFVTRWKEKACLE